MDIMDTVDEVDIKNHSRGIKKWGLKKGEIGYNTGKRCA
jgi:hypothetical protein